MPSGACVIRYEGARGVVWRIKYVDAAGKQVMETIGQEADGVTRKSAEVELRERLTRVEKGRWRRPAPLTFTIASETWYAEAHSEKSWAKATTAQYASIRRRLVDSFGHKRLEEIRPSDVSAYKKAMLDEGYSGASVSRDLSILHSIFAWAVVTERMDRNPADGVPHPAAAKRKGNALRPEEIQALARAFVVEQDRLVFLTLVLCGLRRAELQALRWRDVDLIENRLRVVDSKTETGERSIAIPPTLAERVWQHRRTSSYKGDAERVFCHSDRGSVYRYERFEESLRAAYEAAGMSYPEGMRPFHDLRVTSITNDAIAGANPIALMTKAGHASMATTRRYLQLAGTVFPEEAAALEARVLGGNLLPEPSTDLSESEPISPDFTGSDTAQLHAPA
jgi:integrase